jgi:hypothetical protein
MSLLQVRDVPEVTLRALKALAAERGLTLSAYLRDELGRFATRPTNAEIVERRQPGDNLITAGLYAAKQLVDRVAPTAATP